MDFLQTVIGILALLFILVGVHEFGHFYVARRCGVRVLRFCIGMGKPFWSFRDKHGTEFGLAPFPLGGYVKMLDEREGEVAAADQKYCYNRKSVWQRIAILSAGPSANFILAFVVFAVLAGFEGQVGVAPLVGKVQPNSLADIAGLDEGQEIRTVDGVATPTQQDVLERMLLRLGESGTMELTVANPDSDLAFEVDIPLQNWLRKADEPDPIAGLGMSFYRPQVEVKEVSPDSAAEVAGFEAGDRIIAVDGEDVASMGAYIEYVRERADQPVMVTVARGEGVRELEVTPRQVTAEDGALIGQVGVIVSQAWPEELVRRRNFGPLQALQYGVKRTWDTSVFVLVSMKKLVLGQISTKNLSGPIGIAKVAGDRAQAGFIYFVEFLALLSISLGVLNLLPIPILDGGQILYCLIEGIKGGPIPERIQMLGYSAGLAMLACVMVLALYNDILRL